MAEAKKEPSKTSQPKTKEFLEYKGKPLVRCGDTLYYGSMTEPYVIKMQIKSKTKENNMDIADKVTVQLLSTEPMMNPKKQIIKTSEKPNLYLALDIADVWLERYLRDAESKNV